MKEVTMTIHEFMEIKRGNLQLEDIETETKTFNLGNIFLLLALILPFYMSIPAKAANLTIDPDVAKAFYISGYVIIECLCEIVTSTASIL